MKSARQDELAAFAANYSLQFVPEIPDEPTSVRLMSRFRGLWPFHGGISQHVRDLAFGNYAGLDWTIFEYGHALAAPFGIVCARIPFDLPRIHLSPEDFRYRVECCLGVRQLTLECEEFNERYFVLAADDRAAFDLLHPRAMEYLMGLPSRDWQVCGDQIVLAQRPSFGAEELSKVIAEVEGFVRLIPGYVREDRGIVPDWKGPCS